MPSYDDNWTADGDIPVGLTVDETRAWDTPSGIPVDAYGVSLIPELRHRPPTHNESVLLSGIPVKMASSNVDEIFWNWQEHGKYFPKLFVKFLDGSLYVYKDCPLSVAADMVQSLSPGRYVHNVLRVGWPTADGSAERLIKGTSRGRKKPRVVRLRAPGEK